MRARTLGIDVYQYCGTLTLACAPWRLVGGRRVWRFSVGDFLVRKFPEHCADGVCLGDAGAAELVAVIGTQCTAFGLTKCTEHTSAILSSA
jgi:hypothetical protein